MTKTSMTANVPGESPRGAGKGTRMLLGDLPVTPLRDLYQLTNELQADAVRAGVPYQQFVSWPTEQIFDRTLEYLQGRGMLQGLFLCAAASYRCGEIEGFTSVIEALTFWHENPQDASPDVWACLGMPAKRRVRDMWEQFRTERTATGSLNLADLITQHLLDALANAFPDRYDQAKLLTAVRFPDGSVPNQAACHDASDFWFRVCREIEKGSIDGLTLGSLIAEAANQRPTNPAFNPFR